MAGIESLFGLAVFAAVMPLVGVAMGITAGLLGVAGGIVVVPALYLAFTVAGVDEAVRSHMAIATSLAVIVPASVIAAHDAYRRDDLDVALARRWAIPIVVSSVLGASAAAHLPGSILAALFAVLALTAAVFIVRGWPYGKDTAARADETAQARRPVSGLLACLVGAGSAMLGLGGGTFSVPILERRGYKDSRAAGTSAALGVAITIPATLVYALAGLGVAGRPLISLGYINLAAAALIVPAMILIAPFGSHIADTPRSPTLHYIFAGFLVLAALRMLYGLAVAFADAPTLF